MSTAAIQRALVAAFPALRAEGGLLVLPLSRGRLALRLLPVDAPGKVLRARTIAWTYSLQGGAYASEARALLVRVADAIAAQEESVEDLASLPAALAGPGPIRIAGDLAAQPGLLREPLVELHRSLVESWWKGPPPTVEGLPACLALALRPPMPRARRLPPSALGTICGACGARTVCEGAGMAGWPLRPLRHADDDDAIRAAVQAIADAFGGRVPEAAHAFLDATIGARRAEPGRAHLPFELSVKIQDGALARTLRVVEYAPAATPDGASVLDRRSTVSRIAASLAPRDAASALAEWLERFVVRRGGAELSIGIDAPLDGDAPALQLYAHPEPASAEDARAWVREAFDFAGADASTPLAWLATAPPEVRPTLLSYSPTSDDPRRIKLYFTAPASLRLRDDDALALGSLAPFVPDRGLAVLELGKGEPRFRKRDFPCTVHFQRAQVVLDAFADALAPAERPTFARLFDDRAFTPWPTWLSVGERTRTLYFVPR